MIEVFDILETSEKRSPPSPSTKRLAPKRAYRDRAFRLMVLACLVFSMIIQILVSAWFNDKIETVESRLSVCPVITPEEVDLTVVLPRLGDVSRKIDRLTHQLDGGMGNQQTAWPSRGEAKTEIDVTPVRKDKKTRRFIEVEVVERVKK
ncbi:MAG: hypothetical protein GTN81_16135 [Proteobacteria bacterium]|nr:hypothetical protein [Pseudomonadota bacterium]